MTGARQQDDRRADQAGAEQGVQGEPKGSGPYLLEEPGAGVRGRDLYLKVENHAEPELQNERDQRYQAIPAQARRPRSQN